MIGETLGEGEAAIRDFRLARRRAHLQLLMARLTGRSADLLSYDDVRRQLKARTGIPQGLQEIPLDAIIGSVGRYSDFTRTFLPKHDSDKVRWARVETHVNTVGMEPIEVYKLGEAYFVLDGNHRVSIARQNGAQYIEAYVTDVQTRVPLSPDDDPDALILKARYAEFLERTHLDEFRPDANLTTTAPGQYRVLEEHIQVHRYYMGIDEQRDIPFEEAVAHWYDAVYMPVVEAIRTQDTLRDFPGRTETDLYLWVSEHRAALADELGWEVEPADAARDLAEHASATPQRILARVTEWVWDTVTPDALESGPPTGVWRTQQLTARRTDRMTSEILVPVSGEADDWSALEQAIIVAQREGAHLRGLYVVPNADARTSDQTQAIKAEFARRCSAADVDGQLVAEVGSVARTIVERARWTDLTILNLAHPPEPTPLARLSSGFRTLLLRSPTPILAVPKVASPLTHPLLAYNGRPRADEALFLAAYVANQWQIPLTVLALGSGRMAVDAVVARAEEYLKERDVTATIVTGADPVAESVLAAVDAHNCDLIITGGYTRGAVMHTMLGSAVDGMLIGATVPVLICR